MTTLRRTGDDYRQNIYPYGVFGFAIYSTVRFEDRQTWTEIGAGGSSSEDNKPICKRPDIWTEIEPRESTIERCK